MKQIYFMSAPLRLDFPSILKISIVVALLDGLAAIISAHLQAGVSPDRVFQYIASALIGPDAFSGGGLTIILGVFLHWFISFGWTVIAYLVLPRRRFNTGTQLLFGVVTGLIVYVAMKYIVVPMSLINSPPGSPRADQALIHIFCVGIPIVFMFYRRSGK